MTVIVGDYNYAKGCGTYTYFPATSTPNRANKAYGGRNHAYMATASGSNLSSSWIPPRLNLWYFPATEQSFLMWHSPVGEVEYGFLEMSTFYHTMQLLQRLILDPGAKF